MSETSSAINANELRCTTCGGTWLNHSQPISSWRCLKWSPPEPPAPVPGDAARQEQNLPAYLEREIGERGMNTLRYLHAKEVTALRATVTAQAEEIAQARRYRSAVDRIRMALRLVDRAGASGVLDEIRDAVEDANAE